MYAHPTLQASFLMTPQTWMSHKKSCKTSFFPFFLGKAVITASWKWGFALTDSLVFSLLSQQLSSAHDARDTQKRYKQSHIMDSHNKLTLGSGWCSTQLMPVLIRAWKYYLGLAASSKKSILSQVINSALSDCSPIPGSSMSLSWLLPLKFSLWLALFLFYFTDKKVPASVHTYGLFVYSYSYTPIDE